MDTTIFRTLETLKEKAQDALFQIQACLFQPAAKIKVNGRSFKIVKILGEGGFSFVYLAQDEASGRQFALKKIRCPTGNDAVKEAMREVEAYRRFRHPNIIRILDSAVVQDRDGDGQIVYLFLPYYKHGNLQDAINSHAINGTHFSERELVTLFRGTCQAVSALHDFRASPKSSQPGASSNTKRSNQSNGRPLTPMPEESHEQQGLLPDSRHADDRDHGDDHDHDEHGADAEDDDQGFSYSKNMSIPTSSNPHRGDANDVVFDGDEELQHLEREAPPGADAVPVPYAHRDLKPANVMIDDDGQPILMDFGSTIKARINVETRQQALIQQDLAAEQSSMPYRAPELFDVKTGTTLDEKVDIWSLGCTLFALAYGHSPFETNQTTEQGGSIAMAVLNAQYKQPANSAYSEGFRNLIDSMLKADPEDRPDIHGVIASTERVLQTLS